MIRKASLVAASALAPLASACSEQALPMPPLPLPTERNLPVGFNRDCGCVRDGECAVAEQRPGAIQIRSLSCRWLRLNEVAECRFESRFVEIHSEPDGNFFETADPWQPRTLRAVLLPDGEWCAG